MNLSKLLQVAVKVLPTVARVAPVVPMVLKLVRRPRAAKAVEQVVEVLAPAKEVDTMAEFIKAFFGSAARSVVVALIAALALFAGVPAPVDPIGGVIWAGLLIVVRSVISALQKFVGAPPAES